MRWICFSSLVLGVGSLCAVAAASVALGQPSRDVSHGPSGTVSGRWTVVIRNRAGLVVRRAQFENALVGTNVLPQLLAGSATAGAWEISTVESSPGSGSGKAQKSVSTLKTPANAAIGAETTSVVLSGTVAIAAAGTIGSVSSGLRLCAPTVSPATCDTSVGAVTPYTRKDGLAIPVLSGDSAHFSVVLSVLFPADTRTSEAQTLVRDLLLGFVVPSTWGMFVLDASSASQKDVSGKAAGGSLVFSAAWTWDTQRTFNGFRLENTVCYSGPTETAEISISPNSCSTVSSTWPYRRPVYPFDEYAPQDLLEVPGQQIVLTIRVAFT
jgi:hypothetical protein